MELGQWQTSAEDTLHQSICLLNKLHHFYVKSSNRKSFKQTNKSYLMQCGQFQSWLKAISQEYKKYITKISLIYFLSMPLIIMLTCLSQQLKLSATSQLATSIMLKLWSTMEYLTSPSPFWTTPKGKSGCKSAGFSPTWQPESKIKWSSSCQEKIF